MSSDSEKARVVLKEKSLTCCLCKNREIIESTDHGVTPLLKLLDSKKNVKGFSAADKVVGNAAANLYVLLGVREVYGKVMSKAARKTLTSNGIENSCETETEMIINRKGDGICPMEQAVSKASTPEEALERIKVRLSQLQKKE